MKVQIDPAQLARVGITEEIVIDLPPGFQRFTRAERRAWAYAEIRKESAALLRELLADGGVPGWRAEGAVDAMLRDMTPSALFGEPAWRGDHGNK